MSGSFFLFPIPFETQTVQAQSPQAVSGGVAVLGAGAAAISAPAWVTVAALSIAVGVLGYAACTPDQKATINQLFHEAMEKGFPTHKGQIDVLQLAQIQATQLYKTGNANFTDTSCPTKPLSPEFLVAQMKLVRLFGFVGLLDERVLSNEILFNQAIDDAIQNSIFVREYAKIVNMNAPKAKQIRDATEEEVNNFRKYCSEGWKRYAVFQKLLSMGVVGVVALSMVFDLAFSDPHGSVFRHNPTLSILGNTTIIYIAYLTHSTFDELLRMCQQEKIRWAEPIHVGFYKIIPIVFGIYGTGALWFWGSRLARIFDAEKVNKR